MSPVLEAVGHALNRASLRRDQLLAERRVLVSGVGPGVRIEAELELECDTAACTIDHADAGGEIGRWKIAIIGEVLRLLSRQLPSHLVEEHHVVAGRRFEIRGAVHFLTARVTVAPTGAAAKREACS